MKLSVLIRSDNSHGTDKVQKVNILSVVCVEHTTIIKAFPVLLWFDAFRNEACNRSAKDLGVECLLVRN